VAKRRINPVTHKAMLNQGRFGTGEMRVVRESPPMEVTVSKDVANAIAPQKDRFIRPTWASRPHQFVASYSETFLLITQRARPNSNGEQRGQAFAVFVGRAPPECVRAPDSAPIEAPTARYPAAQQLEAI
jgi:hypothetical protein